MHLVPFSRQAHFQSQNAEIDLLGKFPAYQHFHLSIQPSTWIFFREPGISNHKIGDKWLAKIIGQAEQEYHSKLEQEDAEKRRIERNRRSFRQFVMFVLSMGLAGGILFQQEITAALGIEANVETANAAADGAAGREMTPAGAKGMLAALDASMAGENETGGKKEKGKKRSFDKIKQTFERIEYASTQAEKRANILNEIEEEMGVK